jgi:hypothetical protein
LPDNQVTLGFITGLDYSNPWLSPFEEMQRWKTHPAIRAVLEGGKRVGYGARAITAGGLLSLPKTVFPGGALVGCEAGYLNVSRIKGSHAAIKSGMLAADAIVDAIANGRSHDELSAYPEAFQQSWLHDELDRARNFKQWFKKGLWVASVMNGIEQWLLPKLGIKSPPWTVHRRQPDQARWRDHLRPFEQRVHQQHQPRRKPAAAPHAQGQPRAGGDQPGALRGTRGPLLPGRRVRVREGHRRQRSVARSAADQCAKLRALQDLRHQGPHAKHRLGGP